MQGLKLPNFVLSRLDDPYEENLRYLNMVLSCYSDIEDSMDDTDEL